MRVRIELYRFGTNMKHPEVVVTARGSRKEVDGMMAIVDKYAKENGLLVK